MKYLLLFCTFLLPLSSIASDENDWRSPALEDQVYIQTSEGVVIVELAPFIAPNHVRQFKRLVKEGFYNGLDFYRVIEGFVAQGGDITEKKVSEFKQPLKAEFTRKGQRTSAYVSVQKPDFFAPETGYLHGFSAGRDPKTNEEWLLHCPGNLAMARNNEADSGSSDFYIVLGQATRHLDRNMSSFGRVVFGMTNVQRLNRAPIDAASGVIEKPEARSKILWMKMANDIPAENRLNIEIQKASSESAQQRLTNARSQDNAFFHFKGNGNLDLCYLQLKTRIRP